MESITPRKLLDVASLELTLLAGAGGVDQPMTWVHVSELEDPAAWMDAGEFLVTNGMGIEADADAQVTYVRGLHAQGLAGVAIGFRCPPLSPEMLAEADRLALPLLRIPRQTPFLPIVRMVAAANHDSAQRKLLTSLRIFDTLADVQRSRLERFQQMEEISGFRLLVVDPDGRPLLEGSEPVSGQVRDELQALVADPKHLRFAITGGFGTPIRVGGRVAGFLVALERPGETPSGLGVVRNITTVASLEVAELYREREVARRKGAQTFGRLLDGDVTDAVTGELADRMAGGRVVLVAIERPASAPDMPLPDDEIHHRLADRGLAHMIIVQGDRIFVVLPEGTDVAAVVQEELGLVVGVSAEHDTLTCIPVARREAVWALLQARRMEAGAGALATFSAEAEGTHWLPADIGALTTLVEQVLGDVVRYDAQHDTALVESLRAFFDHDRRLTAAAHALSVHKHTLTYRLKRLEKLTGRQISTVEDQTQLWLALSAMEVVAGEAS